MCKFYCMSSGPSTNLACLHCNTRYCAACLHGEAGVMKSLVKCANCGKKPRTKANNDRTGWASSSMDPAIDRSRRGSNASASSRRSSTCSTSSRRSSTSSQGSIFDRLTDPALYTGAHKHRFDSSGHGRGAAGRDSIRKGTGYVGASGSSGFKGNTNTRSDEVIHDISQICMRK